MKRKHTKLLSFILAAVLLLGLVPRISTTASAEETTTRDQVLAAAIEPQIRAYADSIDQEGANSAAAQALANHGISARGKDLIMGEEHSLTATLMNSELLQVALTDGCVAAIKAMYQTTPKEIQYVYGHCSWYGTAESGYVFNECYSEDTDLESKGSALAYVDTYQGERNAYDESLDWMVAGLQVYIKMERVGTNGGEDTYQVTFRLADRFDFTTKNDSDFKNLISGVGALLFREFDWECNVSFQLTVPGDDPCSHSSAMYRWTYDSESRTFTSDGSNGYRLNEISRHSFVNSLGNTLYYYELDETVRLYHDEPWVLEYDVRSPGTISLSTYPFPGVKMPGIMSGGLSYLTLVDRQHVLLSEADRVKYDREYPDCSSYHYYGIRPNQLFTYSSKMIYTIRLENVINGDGSNMIYASIYDAESGEQVLDRTAMDNYYYWGDWTGTNGISTSELTDWTSGNGWVSGKDLYINFIGNRHYSFSSSYFELRVWENGKDVASKSYYQNEAVEPTCTEQGYTAQVCTACGQRSDVQYVPAKGHSFGDWYTVTAATCGAAGQERRDCAVCGEQETRETAAAEHRYADSVVAPTCMTIGYTTHTCAACGGSYVDAYTDALGHSYDVVVTAATCTDKGYTTRTCTACGDSYVDAPTDALGHDAVVDVAAAATCEESGLTEGSHCGRCGIVLTAQETVPAAGHQFADEQDTDCDVCGFEREAAFLLGDADNSGSVDFFDAMLVLQYYAGIIDETQINLKAANVDTISDVNFFDAMLILQHYAGIIDLNQTAG